jgi:hypothetical protein
MGTERPKLKLYDRAWFLHQTAELINGLISDIGYISTCLNTNPSNDSHFQPLNDIVGSTLTTAYGCGIFQEFSH